MPGEWTPEEEAEYKAAARRAIAFHFGGYRPKPAVAKANPEPPVPQMRPDPEPLPVTPSPASKHPRYNALGQCYGLNSKGKKSHRPTAPKEEQHGTADEGV